MLQELNIKNIALIRDLSISFEDGLNVLSGETGAGKSIIVDSVSLILGARADKELIKYGEEKAFVEALVSIPDSAPFFELLEEYGIDAEEDLIVSRELSVSGKNTCRINGRMVPLTVLRNIMNRLINLHGQEAGREVMVSSNQLGMLDEYIGEEAKNAMQDVALSYNEYNSINKKLKKLNEEGNDKLRTMDMLSFQIKEIEEAAVTVGEEEELLSLRKVMQNAEKIAENLYAVKNNLSGSMGVLEKLHDAISELKSAFAVDDSLREILASLEDAYYSIEDVAETVVSKSDALNFEPEELDKVGDRLAVIRAMRRKYGETEQAVLNYLDEIKERYAALDNMEYQLDELEKKNDEAKKKLAADCAKLSDIRKKHAKILEKQIDKELRELGMPAARFSVDFRLSNPTSHGADEVEFYITLNEGEPPKLLNKVASGGEASRIMLAFKEIMASKDDVATLIFDEIDTGISGRMAKVVAEKMANIAVERQVICVSHLPQIAAMADAGYLIEKSVDSKGTKTEVKRLDENGRINEVARLSGGSATSAALAHAKELISECDAFKSMK